MPTTSNFGWTTPADTDLVKDGASAIRTLGNGVDASMAQLKGGTTGQILSKTSNTDMAFTWIANDQGDITAVTAGTGLTGGGTTGAVTLTNDMATAIDAKGDLIAGTAADAYARLAVGTNGQYLSADSTTSTGLKWITPAGSTLNGVSIATGTISSGTSLTISSLDSYDQLFLALTGLSYASGGSQLKITVNGATTNYYVASVDNRLPSTIAGPAQQTGSNNGWFIGSNYGYDDASNTDNGTFISLFNCKSSSGFTIGHYYAAYKHTTTTDRLITMGHLGLLSNASISSIKIEWADGNTFNGGTYRLVGA